MRKLKGLTITLLLTGCSSKFIFTPSKLPEAVMGKAYNEKIYITGGSGPVASSHSYTLTPQNAGLNIDYCDIKSPARYNCIVISGTPKKAGAVIVHLMGGTIPTSLFSPSEEFDKKINLVSVINNIITHN
ncbi:hypothetical protein [Ewingella americana]|uniref:hypothetical protein n=1 Tax=Ewingella americana TaxID=41202 RepID=UPI00163A7F19|nr:hypothetical protein [Ewingella americana]QMV51525.1 hypothetical protein GXP68_09300 [Ewingella americana]